MGTMAYESGMRKKEWVRTGCNAFEALTRIMDVVGVAKWEDIKGHYVRVKQEDRLVVGIGNIIEDKWFEPREFFKEVENE